MRSGNTYASDGAAEMIKEIIANLRDEVNNIVFLEWTAVMKAKKLQK